MLLAAHPLPLEPFQTQIDHEFCQGSAIAPPLYRAAIEVIEDTGFWEPNQALNQRVSRFWESHRPHSFGAIALFRQESGEYWQGKAQVPRTDYKKNKLIKYETIVGSGSKAYLPPVDPETRQAIARRYGCDIPLEGSFWTWLKSHPAIPIILTEGGKKALALLSLGYVAIALTGVNGGYRANGRIGGAVVPLAKSELIEEINQFAAVERPIVLAFDQDIKQNARDRVTSALFKFGALLKANGAQVAIATWEAADSKGIDDLIVGQGAAAAEHVINTATSFDEWAIALRLAQRVKRRPDLNLGQREFVDVAGDLPRDCDLALHGGKGTAKSKLIQQEILGESWLSMAALQSLAREQAESWGGAFINDGDRYGNRFLKQGQPVDGGSVCIPSLLKVRQIDADVLVLDETTAILQFLLTSKLANKDGIRPLLLTEFERRVREAKRVIVADADLTEEALLYLEAIRGRRFYLIRSERQPLQWTAHLMEGSKNQAIAELLHRAENLPAGTVLYANFDEKRTANAIAAILQSRGIQSLLITQETSGGELERSFLASKGRDLPSLINSGVRAIITSPSVTQGFSIECHTDLIDAVFGIYGGSSISSDAIAQALDRVRAPIDRFVSIPKRGRAYSHLSKALNSKDFLREFKTCGTSTARLARLSLKPETTAIVDTLDWESANLKLIASFEVSRNQGMVALRDTVCALLRHEGKTIQPFTSMLTKDSVQATVQAIHHANNTANLMRAIAISTAIELTDEEAAALEHRSRSGSLLQSELDSLQRYYIAKFYRLQTVDQATVEFDDHGRTRTQIRNLENILHETAAVEQSAKSIDQNATTPQDWDKAVLRRWLLVKSGAIQLIEGIWDGSIHDLTPDIITPIAAILKRHSHEFKLAFGFSNLTKVTDVQAIATVLNWCGIKRICDRRRVGKKIRRFYAVDLKYLETLRAIVERRSQSVTPPEIDQQIRGDGTASQFTTLVDFEPSGKSRKDSGTKIPMSSGASSLDMSTVSGTGLGLERFASKPLGR